MSVSSSSGAPLGFDEARTTANRLGRRIRAKETDRIGVDDEPSPVVRVLACRVDAVAHVPSADMAAMDGYAVSGPGPWMLTGTALAGDSERREPLARGEARLIATGAVVPAGTDAVIRHEDVAGDWPPTSETVRLETDRHEVNIRRAGEELRPGAPIGRRGTVVTGAFRGLAAAAGLDELPVCRPPTIAVIATGNELQTTGRPDAGKTRDAISPVIRQLIPAAGGETIRIDRVADDAALLTEHLTEAAASADIVVTTGMASSGPTDLVRDVLAGLGARVNVPTVQVRPGGPQTMSTLPDGVPVVSLPGNPLAAVVGFHTLVLPLVRGTLGAPPPPPLPATLHFPPETKPGVSTVLPVAMDEAGRMIPSEWGRAAQLRGLAHADGLAVTGPAGAARLLRWD